MDCIHSRNAGVSLPGFGDEDNVRFSVHLYLCLLSLAKGSD